MTSRTTSDSNDIHQLRLLKMFEIEGLVCAYLNQGPGRLYVRLSAETHIESGWGFVVYRQGKVVAGTDCRGLLYGGFEHAVGD